MKSGKLLQLRHADGGLEVGRLQVVADVGVDVLVVVAVGQVAQLPVEPLPAGVGLSRIAPAIAPPVAERRGDLLEERLVGGHGPALSHGDVVGGVEAEGGEVPEGPGQTSPVAGAQRVAVVLDQPEPLLARQRADRVQIEGVAEGVRQEDRARARTDRLGHPRGRRIVGAELDVHEDRHEPVLEDRVDGGRKSRGRSDDLVARLAGAARRAPPLSARRAPAGWPTNRSCTEARCAGPAAAARSRSKSAANRPAVSQKSSDASTKDATSSASKTRPETGTGVSPATKSRVRPLDLRVVADQGEDPAAQLLRRHAAPSRRARYHPIVSRRPRSRVHFGCQPSSRAALALSKCWSRISARAVFSMTGARSSRPASLQDRAGDLEDGGGLRRPEVERLAADLGQLDALGHREVGVDRVVDIHVVAPVPAVGADDRGLAGERRPDRPGDQAAPVQVPAAVDVPAARDDDRQLVGLNVAGGQKIGAALGDVVGMPPARGHVLGVGQHRGLAVGLVARGDDDAPDHVAVAAARLPAACRSRGCCSRTWRAGCGIPFRRASAPPGERPSPRPARPSARSTSSMDSSFPETTRQASIAPERMSSDCGSQSRTRAATRAPASIKPGHERGADQAGRRR